MILVRAGDAVYMERRPPAGIWGGLWSFPELDTQQNISSWCEQNLRVIPTDMQEWQTLRHSFTHYDLDIVPVAINLQSIAAHVADDPDRLWHELHSPLEVGMAAPVSGLMARLKDSSTNL